MPRLALICATLAALHGTPDGAWPQTSSQRAEIALAGDFLGHGPWPEDGSDWLGLYSEGGGDRLEAVRLRSSRIEHACSGFATRISVPGEATPLLLVRGVPSMRVGPVQGAFRGELFLYPGQSRSIQSGNDVWYTLQAFGSAVPRNQEALVTDYTLSLRQGARVQRLASFPRIDSDGLPQVLWAGDLDRDGKLDVLADLRRHYAGHRYALFLSSAAAADSLVREVAHLDVPGC